MKLNIPTPTIESWQIAGWVDQGYSVKSILEGYEGIVAHIRPGAIVLDTGECKLVQLANIPTKDAWLDDPFIVIGRKE